METENYFQNISVSEFRSYLINLNLGFTCLIKKIYTCWFGYKLRFRKKPKDNHCDSDKQKCLF